MAHGDEDSQRRATALHRPVTVMSLRRLAGRIRGRVRRPLLSVVVLCDGAGPLAEGAVRSVLNQSCRDLEVLAVVSAEDDAAEVVALLAAHDRRIRPVAEGDVEDAIGLARGRLLTVVDGHDSVLAGAYEAMTGALRRSGADAVVGASRCLSALGPSRCDPPQEHRAARLEEVPGLLRGPIAGAVLARTRLWATALDATGGPRSLPERTIGVLLGAGTLDSLDTEVYAWRSGSSVPGPSARNDAAALCDLAERLGAAASGETEPVRSGLLTHRLGPDLVRLAERCPLEAPVLADRIRRTARSILPSAESSMWSGMRLLDRVLLWVLAHGDQEDLEEVLGSRVEDSTCVPLVVGEGGLIAQPPVLDRIRGVPAQLTGVQDADLVLRCVVDSVGWSGREVLVVRGAAYIEGVDPADTGAPVIEAVGPDGKVLARRVASRCRTPQADLDAGDPWRSYAESGFTVAVPAGEGTSRLRASIAVANRDLTCWLPAPAGSARSVPSPSEDGERRAARGDAHGLLEVAPLLSGAAEPEAPSGNGPHHRVILTGASLTKGGRLRLSGRSTGLDGGFDLLLVSSRGRVRAAAVPETAGTWRADLDLTEPTTARGAYSLRWESADASGACTVGEDLDGPATELSGSVRSARLVAHRDGSAAVTVMAPLSVTERSRRGRQLLVEQDMGPLVRGVFLESFRGRSGGDNPAAICADLVSHGLDAPVWWSVEDGTVPVPSGADAVVVGSEPWFRALRTAHVIVTNDNLPSWFSKREGQRLLQTWHGTPIKRLLNDAAPGAVSLVYRRLMARQVPQWDLLLAQNEEARRNLCSAMGYTGDVLVGEYPRNAGLLGGTRVRYQVRAELGVPEESPVLLYAPTWRESFRGADGAGPGSLLDAKALAQRTGAVVLVRSHHMNRWRAEHNGIAQVIDVSGHPRVEDLMLAADVLVTDYSSIVFDFDLTGRPIVIYAPDLESYRDVERGLYGGWPEAAAWPLVRTQSELEAVLRRALTSPRSAGSVDPAPVKENLARIRQWILDSLDGKQPI